MTYATSFWSIAAWSAAFLPSVLAADPVFVSGVAPDDRLNLRAGPHVSFAATGTLAPGEGHLERGVCTYLAPKPGAARWCHLSRAGVAMGWVNGRYLSDQDESYLFEPYPDANSPCRKAGETGLTVDWLDHTATLVACPDPSRAIAGLVLDAGAEIVGRAQGFVFLSVPDS